MKLKAFLSFCCGCDSRQYGLLLWMWR